MTTLTVLKPEELKRASELLPKLDETGLIFSSDAALEQAA